MMKRIKLFIPLVIFGALGYVFINALDKDPSVLPLMTLGKPFPEFSLPSLSDPEKILTKADLPPPPFLVNVWASWCSTCRYEHPYFLELQARGIPIVGLNYKNDRESALKWLADLGNPYSTVIVDFDGRLALDLGITGAPETYLVDTDGKIAVHQIGMVTEKVWNESFQAYFPSKASN